MSEDPFLQEMIEYCTKAIPDAATASATEVFSVPLLPAQVEELREWLSANPVGTPLSESQRLVLSVPDAVGELPDFQSQSATESGSNSEETGS